MNRTRYPDHLGRAGMRLPAALLLIGVATASCSSSLLDSASEPAATPAPTSPSPSFGTRISSLFGNPRSQTPAPQTQATAAPGSVEIDCPVVEVRSGTTTLSVTGAGEGAAALRYQASLGRTARECSTNAGTLNMKVGVQGRVVLGPSGGPGQLDLPLRYAVVKEGPEPKTIISKLSRVAVTIPPEQGNVPFVHVEEALSVPLPPQTELDAYVIYIGFDPQGAKVQDKKPPPRRGQQQR